MNAAGGSLGGSSLAQRFLVLIRGKTPYLGTNEDVRDLVLLAEHRNVRNDVHRVDVRCQNENTSGQVE